MTLWTSVITVVLFSFLVIGVDEYWHWLRRRRKQRQAPGKSGRSS
jgi:hypothetical protein